MSERPYRHLCPEADERDAMDDGEFWERVASNLGFNSDPYADDGPDMDAALDVGTCETCGSDGACGYDSEGRALIHTTTADPERAALAKGGDA